MPELKTSNVAVACVKSGESLIKHKLCFSKDSRFIFIAVGSSVKVYSTKTTEVVNVLSNNDREIVALFLNPQNHLQLITLSSCGYICYWDYEDAILIRKIKIFLRVKFGFILADENSFGILTKSGTIVCVKVNLDDATSSNVEFNANVKGVQSFSISNNKEYLATVSKNSLKIKNLDDKILREHLITNTMEFICVEWHPKDECIATGNNIGRIDIWYNYLERQPTKSIFHWHSLPVNDISFTSSGNFFYSGGGESVLVKWQLGSQQRQFVPRMGLPISWISCSPDSNIVATSHTDNSIVLLNQNNNILGVIQGLTHTTHWNEVFMQPIPTGLLFDKNTSTIVLNGKPGHLQFYDVQQDKQIFNLDIVQENYICEERNRKIYHLEIIKAAFDEKCEWLATVEYWNNRESSFELRLKFWKYIKNNQSFSLNTTIEMPHEEIINCVVFQPNNQSSSALLAVTTADDDSFKIWSLISGNSQDDESWTCRSVGFYRHEKAGDACFSDDGSVLCVAFNQYLTLWLPEVNVLRTALCNNEEEKILQVRFGCMECSSIVVCYTAKTLTAWDTLAFTTLWCVDFTCTYLIGDPKSSVMAAFSNKNIIFLFKPSDPNPISISNLNTNKSSNGKANVIAAIFLNLNHRNISGEHSELFFMTSDQLLYTLTDKESIENSSSTTKKIFGLQSASLTPFGLLLAENRKSGVEKIEKHINEIQNSKGKQIINMVLSTPSHVLPSPFELCSAYLDIVITENEKKADQDFVSLSYRETTSTDWNETNTSNVEIKSGQKPTNNESWGVDEDALKSVYQGDSSWIRNLFAT